MIIVVDNLIDHKMVTAIHDISIQRMNSNFQVWRDTKTVEIEYLNNNQVNNDQVINDALKIITDAAAKYFTNVIFDWGQFVEWPVGSHQQFHLDKTSNKTVLVSITYLNSNFRGGETIFADGTQIAPLPGRTVFFNGNLYPHAVYSVSGGSRFTIPIWYKQG
jgi:hypothetical protein